MQTRRIFLGTLAAAATGCATISHWTIDVLDAHTHFYNPARPQGVPWPPKEDALLYRPVLPDELKSIAQPLGVAGTIVVEASPWVEDNEFILDLARNEPFIKGLVGHLKPGKPDFKRDLDRFAANQLFRGIRVGLWDIPINVENSEFIQDLKRLADRDLSLDVLGGAAELIHVANLARAIPGLRIIIDHCAGVRITGGALDSNWLNAIRDAAAHPNIHMKVSGLVEGTGRENDAPVDVEFYRLALDALWNAFGEDRVIFGSNWPVSARFAGYPAVLKIVHDYVAAKSSAASRKYFRQNAERIYLRM